jgi:hypothetical protein
MNEKQFDWLDERLREAADQHEPPFDEASWQELESKLANSKPKRRAAWWWFTDALILGLLVFIAFHLVQPGQVIPNMDNDKSEAVVATSSSTPHAQHAPTVPGTTSNDLTQATPAETAITNDPSFSSDASNTPSFSTNRVAKKSRTANTNHIAGSSDAVSLQSQVANSRIDDNNAGITKASDAGIIKKYEESLTPTKGIVKDEKAGYLAGDQSIPSAEMQASPVQPETAEAQNDKQEATAALAESALPPSAAEKKSLNKKPSDKGFYVYGMAGSEWSLVPGNEQGKTTFAWGMGAGYRISPKWAVQAGYFKTQKVYTAGPGDYKPKPGTYYYNLTIKEVEADCHITEIPIAISYTLFDTRKQSLYASLGFSSYIMKSEEYHYDYIRANSTPGYSKYYYQTNNSHLFAGLLLSGGYNFKLFDGFSLSAEPYLKVPLYGVGEGSIKIYSFGLMAGARYSLPSLRRK